MAAQETRYGERVLTVEPYGVEPVPARERHGYPVHLFTLWLGTNLTIADYALGFIPIGLGLSLPATLLALLAGNLLGGAGLALATAMGPGTGLPQMVAGRGAFGRRGGYLPAALNWVNTVGWFTVNTILGAFGLRLLLPGLGFVAGALLLTAIQLILAVFGYNLIHLFERIMAVALGIAFLAATVVALGHGQALAAWHGTVTAGSAGAAIAIAFGAAFSYIVAWAPYAADYARYLPADTPAASCFGWTLLGGGVASFWLEILGALIAVLVGKGTSDPVAALRVALGGFGTVVVLAVVVGAIAANAVNLYSNALSAGALDLKVPRWLLVVVAAVVGAVLSLYGSGHFSEKYSSFLILLDYWITPWLAVVFVDYFLLRRRGAGAGIRWSGLGAYLIGIAVSVPFMGSSSLYTGPVAKALHGADYSYFVAFLVAGALYWAAGRRFAPARSGAGNSDSGAAGAAHGDR